MEKNTIKVSEFLTMSQNEIKEIFKGKKKVQLLNNKKIVSDKENISDLYRDTLEELAKQEVEIDQILGNSCSQDKDAVTGRKHKFVDIGSGKFFIDVDNDTVKKMMNLKKCFGKLKSTKVENYEFNIPMDKNQGNEREVFKMNDQKLGVLVENAIVNNKQVIFTGAPGTGKTFSVREYVENECPDSLQYKFVQFHPSYDYTDFVEGLRPVILGKNDEISFVRIDGIFKEFCRHIVEQNKKEENKEKIENQKNEDNSSTQGGDVESDEDQLEERKYSKNYYFIVDEINRADLSKVFGELMFGLEESYRGEKNRILTQYRNLPTYKIVEGKAEMIEEDVFKDGFYIPENLYFIGTMNDIDRSVDSMDFALRRRFTWIEIKANYIMETSLLNIFALKNEKLDTNDLKELVKKWSECIKKMNNVISSNFGLTDAYHIGPAYFKINLSKAEKNNADEFVEDSIRKIFDNNITSILREYTRGRNDQDVKDFIEACRQELFAENSFGESNA